MSAPTPYDREFDFTSFQASAPVTPLPGSHVDAEYNRVKVSLDSLAANLSLIQRDDGELANGSVGLDQLSADITVGVNAATLWLTATAYTTSDFVFNGFKYYHCLVAHTSGTFATDLAAGKWLLLVDFTLAAASTSAPGSVELATDAEAIAKGDTTRALTPSNLAALDASDTVSGFVELATDVEAIAKAVTNRAVTPANLAALGASDTFAGFVELATDAEAVAAAATNRAVTPANLAAFQLSVIAAVYPVGSIYISINSTNPATSLGFGTWTAFGAGRVPVGFDGAQTEFDTDQETGGAKTHTLITAEMPAHTHSVAARTAADNTVAFTNAGANDAGPTSITSGSTGGGGAHNNLQPYIVVRMWKRTA